MDVDILGISLLLLCAFLVVAYAGFLALYVYVKRLADCGKLEDEEEGDGNGNENE